MTNGGRESLTMRAGNQMTFRVHWKKIKRPMFAIFKSVEKAEVELCYYSNRKALREEVRVTNKVCVGIPPPSSSSKWFSVRPVDKGETMVHIVHYM